MELLKNLPDVELDRELSYRVAIKRGNASMRIPGHVEEARTYVLDALERAQHLGIGSTDERALREAEAHKELGYYYRNLGYWIDADASYRQARDVLVRVMGPGSPPDFREEMASIQTNWAYPKALPGSFRDAQPRRHCCGGPPAKPPTSLTPSRRGEAASARSPSLRRCLH